MPWHGSRSQINTLVHSQNLWLIRCPGLVQTGDLPRIIDGRRRGWAMKTWSDILQTDDDLILEWAAKQPWAQPMKVCGQNSAWHAEGPVWTHTEMVCGELRRLPEWDSLERARQVRLLFAGLLHDSGKPETIATDATNQLMPSPDHAVAGAQLARRVLRELGCPLEEREAICNLVCYHSRPTHLSETLNPAREVISLSWLVNNQDLHMLALADARGRITRGGRKPEEPLRLWTKLAREQNCWEQPYGFRNDHARFLFYRGLSDALSQDPGPAFRCAVTLMSGLPGAGKAAWLSRHKPGQPVVTLAALGEDGDPLSLQNQDREIRAAVERTKEHLRQGTAFALIAPNLRRESRSRWITLLAAHPVRIEIVYIEPPLPFVYEGNGRRQQPLPQSVLDTLVERLEPPTLTESHGLRFVEYTDSQTSP